MSKHYREMNGVKHPFHFAESMRRASVRN